MDAPGSLQAKRRQVGLCSHVQEMTARIGAGSQVKCLSRSQSQLFVSEP